MLNNGEKQPDIAQSYGSLASKRVVSAITASIVQCGAMDMNPHLWLGDRQGIVTVTRLDAGRHVAEIHSSI